MGQVCGSLNLTPEEKERAKKSGQLDSLLKKRNNEVKEEVKLLLLGRSTLDNHSRTTADRCHSQGLVSLERAPFSSR